MKSNSNNSEDGGNTITPSRFRKACFTLNNYTVDEYNSITLGFEGSKYIIGKEVGDQGTPHLQGYVEFGKQVYFTTMKKWNERIHWERTKGTREQNITYCSKDGDFVSTFPVPLKSKLLAKFKDVEWYPWQKDIIDIIEKNDDGDRTFNWYWETKGNVGKSWLCKFLCLKYDAIICDGKKDNVMNQVRTWMEDNKEQSPRVVIMDVPRTNIEYINYGVLEQLKNGLIYSGKYEGGVCIFESPIVVIFANEMPDVDKISLDRWNIIEIKGL